LADTSSPKTSANNSEQKHAEVPAVPHRNWDHPKPSIKSHTFGEWCKVTTDFRGQGFLVRPVFFCLRVLYGFLLEQPWEKYKMDFLGTQDANGKKIKLHDQLFTN